MSDAVDEVQQVGFAVACTDMHLCVGVFGNEQDASKLALMLMAKPGSDCVYKVLPFFAPAGQGVTKEVETIDEQKAHPGRYL